MGKITKGFATTTAVIGVLLVVCGVVTSVCGWFLQSKIPSDFTFRSTEYSSSFFSARSFGPYWWGGISFFVPGILGIITGCTRNVCVMSFFLFFDILCIFGSIGVTVLVASVMVAWMAVSGSLSGDMGYNCATLFETCVCTESLSEQITFNAPCDSLLDVQAPLTGIVIAAALACLLCMIASYISCCSLCNQEQRSQGTIVLQQQPAVMVNNQNFVPQAGYQPTSGYPQHVSYPPQVGYPPHVGYLQPATNGNSHPQYTDQPPAYDVGDKAKLVDNVI